MGPKTTEDAATHRRKSLWHAVSCKHGSPGGEGAGPSRLCSQRPRGQGQVHGGPARWGGAGRPHRSKGAEASGLGGGAWAEDQEPDENVSRLSRICFPSGTCFLTVVTAQVTGLMRGPRCGAAPSGLNSRHGYPTLQEPLET